MKALRYIRRSGKLKVSTATILGGTGVITIGGWTGTVIWENNENGWEHVSVSPLDHSIVPTWDDMCEIKDLFWDEEEAVLQIHPPKSKYVNMMPNCLHLWRPINGIKNMNPEWDEVNR